MTKYDCLKGRLVLVWADGWRTGKVTRVRAGKRKGLAALRVAGPRYEGRGPGGADKWSWRGRGRTIRCEAPSRNVKGVHYRGRVVPLEEWVAARPV